METADPNVNSIRYGRLEKILECKLLPSSILPKGYVDRTLLLALITPCNTLQGENASKTIVSYSRLLQPIVVDLQTVSCIVGQVLSRKTTYIVDRSTEFCRPTFVEEDYYSDDENDIAAMFE